MDLISVTLRICITKIKRRIDDMRCNKLMFILLMSSVSIGLHDNVKAQTDMESVAYEE